MQYDAYIFLGPIGLVICKTLRQLLLLSVLAPRLQLWFLESVFLKPVPSVLFPDTVPKQFLPRTCSYLIHCNFLAGNSHKQSYTMWNLEALADWHLFLRLTTYKLDSHVRPPARIWLVGAQAGLLRLYCRLEKGLVHSHYCSPRNMLRPHGSSHMRIGCLLRFGKQHMLA